MAREQPEWEEGDSIIATTRTLGRHAAQEWIRMIAAADQEIDIGLADGEYRRGEGTLSLVVSVCERID